jgi:hypothetical protein
MSPRARDLSRVPGCVTRPNQVHLCCGSRLRLRGLRTHGYPSARPVGYMSNWQFTWLTPHSQRDRPGLPWRTKERKGRKDTLRLHIRDEDGATRRRLAMVLILPFVLVARNPIISCLAAPRSQVILTGRVALRPLRSLREPFSFPLNPGRPASGWTSAPGWSDPRKS